MVIRHITYSLDSALLGVAVNFVIAVFAIMVWWVYRRQLATMNAALEESRRNNQATEDANRKLLEESRKDSLTALEETRRSNAATERSNEIAEQSLVLGRRSWLIAVDINAPAIFAPGKPWGVSVTVRNCGGIPATNVNSRFGLILVRNHQPLPEEIELSTDPPTGVAIITPGSVERTAGSQWLILPELEVREIKSGDLRLYIYNRLDYRDALLDMQERHRWSSGCWIFDSERKRWLIAEKHNNAP